MDENDFRGSLSSIDELRKTEQNRFSRGLFRQSACVVREQRAGDVIDSGMQAAHGLCCSARSRAVAEHRSFTKAATHQ
jgi:hypothetical protein